MKIINDIKQYAVEEYDEIVEEFTDFFGNKYPDDVILYQFGNTAHPSVSDLDLAIIIDDRRTEASMIRMIIADAKTFVRADERRRYIFTHAILIFPIKTFRYSIYDSNIPNKKHLYGDKIILVEGEKDLQIILDLRLINYATNTLRNYERMRPKSQVGLRDFLKLYSAASHEFESYLACVPVAKNRKKELEDLVSEIKTYRRTIIDESFQQIYDENNMITFLDTIYDEFKYIYIDAMALISQRLTHKLIKEDILFLENRRINKKHLLYIYVGALYGGIFSEKHNCYANVLHHFYPVDISKIYFNQDYVRVIEIQATILLDACRFYQEYEVRIGGPLMCSYCLPKLSYKEKIRFSLQKFLYRLQGL